MVLGVLQRVSFVIAIAVGLLFAVSTDGFTHSGGTDKHGCHAGSQPYHCHGGGSGSGGSGGGGGGVSEKPVETGPSAAELAQQAEISRAKADVSKAEANHESSKKAAEEIQQKLESSNKKVEDQRAAIAGTQEEIDRDREKASNLRSSLIADREEASERITLVRTQNREARDLHENNVVGAAFLGTLLGGFLLYRVARWAAGLVVGLWLRIALLVVGLVASVLLLVISPTIGSLGVGAVLAALAGLLFAFLLMLVRTWLIAATLPPKLAFSLLSVAAIVAIIALAGAFSAPPVAQSPAQEDQAMVQEAETDPMAEGLVEANEADAAADDLQTQVDTLSGDLDAIESELDDLAERAEKAKDKATADQEAVASAKDALDSVQ